MKRPVPPDPGPGYRLLRCKTREHGGEVIKAGDDFLHGGGWYPTTCVGEFQGAAGKDKWRRRRTDAPVPHPSKAAETAQRLVTMLFTDGIDGKLAEHLVMKSAEGRYGSGWGRQAAYTRILSVLNGEDPDAY